jgi:osmoprotectant transport system permease protein
MDIISQTAVWLTDPAHWQGPDGIPNRVSEHLLISGLSLAIALLIALPIGVWVGHTGRYSSIAVNAANLGRAMPSIAIIAIVLPITTAIDPQAGFRFYPTLIAMVILAVPPILVNAYAGISGVEKELVESARGMGMREREILLLVEIPVALPVIVAGIRLAAVQVVATATLGAIFAFGGLGRYLVDGIAQNDDPMIFAGVALVAALAITTELVFAAFQRLATSPGLRLERPAVRPEQQLAPIKGSW